MKNCFSLVVLSACILLGSCRHRNSVSQVYETPFPLDEINAYFDIPYDTVAFANGLGDTTVFIYRSEDYVFHEYKYHGEWETNIGEEEGDEEEEPEGGDKWFESYGMEVYVRKGHYYEASQYNADGNSRYPYLELQVAVNERVEASMYINNQYDKDNKYQTYNAQIKLRKPSNDIFAIFKDTVYLNECYYLDMNAIRDGDFETPSDKDHAIVERGKGIVEYTVLGSETWRLVE